MKPMERDFSLPMGDVPQAPQSPDARADLLAENAQLKERLEAANARGDAALVDMERAITKLDHILTSTEEGTLPWWQKKHDDLALRGLEAVAELCAKIEDAQKDALFAIEQKYSETARADKAEACSAELRTELIARHGPGNHDPEKCSTCRALALARELLPEAKT